MSGYDAHRVSAGAYQRRSRSEALTLVASQLDEQICVGLALHGDSAVLPVLTRPQLPSLARAVDRAPERNPSVTPSRTFPGQLARKQARFAAPSLDPDPLGR
jgi:hypothetical protein